MVCNSRFDTLSREIGMAYKFNHWIENNEIIDANGTAILSMLLKISNITAIAWEDIPHPVAREY
jgi:hypothetical protein